MREREFFPPTEETKIRIEILDTEKIRGNGKRAHSSCGRISPALGNAFFVGKRYAASLFFTQIF